MAPLLYASAELLTVDIEPEEARAGIRDLSDPAYPVLARSLRTRTAPTTTEHRATMAALEARAGNAA